METLNSSVIGWSQKIDKDYRIGGWCEQDPNDAFKAVCTLWKKRHKQLEEVADT